MLFRSGKLQVSREQLVPTGSFQGINVGATQPLGKIVLPFTFGTRKNYRTENITFDVSDMPLPYNGILGCPALAKFMAVAHYAYNTLNMPAEWGVLTVKAVAKDAIFCIEQIYKTAVALEPAKEPGSPQEDEPGSSTQEGSHCCTCMPFGPKNAGATLQRAMRGEKRPREAPKDVSGATPGNAAGGSPGAGPGKTASVGSAPRQQKIRGEQQLTKKVLLHSDAARSVDIGATLSRK